MTKRKLEAVCAIYPDRDRNPREWTVGVKIEGFPSLEKARAFAEFCKTFFDSEECRSRIDIIAAVESEPRDMRH